MTWERIRLKRLFETATGGSWGSPPGDGDVDAHCIRGTDLLFDQLSVDMEKTPIRSYTASDIAYRSVRPGDLVIEKSGGGEKQPVGRVGLVSAAALAVPTNFAGRLRPAPSHEPRFLAYLLASLYWAGRTTAAIKQTTGIQNLDVEELLMNQVTIPQQKEQRAIADYLDAETARIDTLMTKKQRLLAVLAERRMSRLQELLWGSNERVRLKFVADLLPGYAFSSDEFGPSEVGERLLRGANVGIGVVDWQDAVRLDLHAPFQERYRLDVRDLVLGMDRPFIKAGTRVARIAEDEAGALLVQRVCRIRPFGISGGVVEAALGSVEFQAYVEADLTGVSVPHLSDEQIGNFEMPILDEDCSREVNELLVSGVTASTQLTRQLDLLAEHRRALVTAAVTGELRVPGVA